MGPTVPVCRGCEGENLGGVASLVLILGGRLSWTGSSYFLATPGISHASAFRINALTGAGR